jgi:hypothetical protein
MRNGAQLPEHHADRLAQIVDQAWLILKSHFVQGRHPILLEAPFQHHFAHILDGYGHLCCTKRDDLFLVDLEFKQSDSTGGREYLDIACSFPDLARCAIELKFKTKKQGAQDHGRIDAFCDIAALERACQNGFDLGRFYMITNSSVYVNHSRRGVGTVFSMHHGHQTAAGSSFHCPKSVGRQDVKVTLKHSYKFEWERINEWYFLALNVVP